MYDIYRIFGGVTAHRGNANTIDRARDLLIKDSALDDGLWYAEVARSNRPLVWGVRGILYRHTSQAVAAFSGLAPLPVLRLDPQPEEREDDDPKPRPRRAPRETKNGKPAGAQEHKASPAFVTAIDAAEGIVEAIVSVMGVIDDGNDMIPAGAFTKTLTEHGHRVKVLNSHNNMDVTAVIGKPIEMREVGRGSLPADVLTRYPEAVGGLYTKTQYLLSDPESKAVFDRIAAGFVNEYSIGYDPVDTELTKLPGPDGKPRTVRLLKQVRLWEYSPVVWGMNPATATVAVKDVAGSGEDTDSEAKEYTPDGPQRQLGDALIAEMMRALHGMMDQCLADGYISGDEHQQITALCNTGIEVIKIGLPADVALRPMTSPMDWLFMLAGDGPDEGKAGRALSARNWSSIEQAVSLLTDVLENAGRSADDENDKAATAPEHHTGQEDVKAGPLPDPTPTAEAGPLDEQTPTDEIAALLARAKSSLSQLEG